MQKYPWTNEWWDWCELIVCTGTVLVSILWGLHVVNRTWTSCYFSRKRCWLVFSYHGEFSRFQVSKYIEYSAYTGCISLYIYCLITCNIKSLLNVPKISHISRKISQVSRFPAKSPDSRNKFVFLPKQPLLELSPPVLHHTFRSVEIADLRRSVSIDEVPWKTNVSVTDRMKESLIPCWSIMLKEEITS